MRILLRNEQGFSLVGALAVGFILILLFFGVTKTMVNQGSMQGKFNARAATHKTAELKLYSLLDLPWSDAALVEGIHTGGDFSWVVTPLDGPATSSARFIQIEVKVTNAKTTKGWAIATTGYKYNDF